MKINLKKLGARAAVGATALVVATTASAGDLADAITTELSGAKAEMLLVGGVVLTLAGVALLIRHVRKAAN